MNMEKRLQNLLHNEIPLSQAIGIEVKEYDGERLCLSAPLKNNINHKMAAFGGSLYSVAVLSGWGLIHLKLEEQGLAGHIVIHESRAVYSKPVTGDIVACSRMGSPEQLDKALTLFQRKGRCRIDLTALVKQGGEEAFRLEGRYVVHR